MSETAKEIKEYLDQYIAGQEEAKIAASVFIYNHLRGVRDTMMFVGPSGCGKTEIFRKLAEKYPKKIFIYDASHITPSGYHGDNAGSLFAYMAGSWTKEEIESAVIVLDEIDKIFLGTRQGSDRDWILRTQGELLTMLEGGTASYGREDKGTLKTFDTRNISFVLCGAFARLRGAKEEAANKRSIGFSDITNTDPKKEIDIDDIIEYGMLPEMAGRITSLVNLKALTKEDIRMLITSPTAGPIKNAEIRNRVSIVYDNGLVDEMVEMAMSEKLGIRSLNGYVQKMVNQELFEEGMSGKITLVLNTEPQKNEPDIKELPDDEDTAEEACEKQTYEDVKTPKDIFAETLRKNLETKG